MEVLISDPFYSSMFVLLALVLVILEIFVPSAGILSLFAVGSATLGIWGFLHQDRPLWAVGAIFGSVAFVVFAIRYALRRFQLADSLGADMKTVSVDSEMDSLVGRDGISLTALRPAGLAEIDGRRVDVVAAGRFIEKARRVRVIDLSGNRVVVRDVTDEVVAPTSPEIDGNERSDPHPTAEGFPTPG